MVPSSCSTKAKPLGNSLAADNPFRFSTKYTDTESGLIYYGYRYYDPITGRWLNRDPIGVRREANLYALVANDAVMKIDWLGLATLKKPVKLAYQRFVSGCLTPGGHIAPPTYVDIEMKAEVQIHVDCIEDGRRVSWEGATVKLIERGAGIADEYLIQLITLGFGDFDFEVIVDDDYDVSDSRPCPNGLQGEQSDVTLTVYLLQKGQFQILIIAALGIELTVKTKTVASGDVTFTYSCCCTP